MSERQPHTQDESERMLREQAVMEAYANPNQDKLFDDGFVSTSFEEMTTDQVINKLIVADVVKTNVDDANTATKFARERLNSDELSVYDLARVQAKGEFFGSEATEYLADKAIRQKRRNNRYKQVGNYTAEEDAENERVVDTQIEEAKQLELKRLQERYPNKFKPQEPNPQEPKQQDKKPGTDLVKYTPKELDIIDSKDDNDDDPTRVMDIENVRLEYLLQEFRDARDEYARVSVTRGSKILRGVNKGQEYDKDTIAKARAQYEKIHFELVEQEVAIARQSGISGKDLLKVATAAGAENEWSLTNAIYDHRMVASGRARFDHGNFEEIQPKTPIGLIANKFSGWWDKQDGKLGMAKKAAASVAIGVVAGAVMAPTGIFVLGPIAGGALGATVASKLAKKSQRTDTLHNDLQQEIMHQRNGAFGNTVDYQTETNLKNNRRRLAGMAIAGAAGGAVGSIGVGNLINGGHGSGAHHTAHATHNHQPAHHAKIHNQQHHNKHHQHNKNHKHNSHTKPEHNQHTVNGNNVNNEYVSTVYEHQLGLHPGFTNMEHAARLAHQAHELNVVYPNPANHAQFFYQTVKGHSDTKSVLKVLSKYGGKVKVR